MNAPMTLPSKEVLKLVGWISTGAITTGGAAWRFLEWRYVPQPTYQVHMLRDSVTLEGIHVDLQSIQRSVDDIGTRVEQIQCGPRIKQGCR